MVNGTRTPWWARASDETLLSTRLKDLGLRLEETRLSRLVRRLHAELRARGIPFQPRVWLSTEWFTPHGVDGFALPFWLAHPRLVELERSQIGSVEGESEEECLQLMRHETGHVLLNAFRLHRRKAWRERFGMASDPYRMTYRPDPKSRDFVQHLPGWYAQSHPVEDFCETFAVWLRPGRNWRYRYARWGAMKKLRYVDEEMTRIAGERRERLSRERTEDVSGLRSTLETHYGVRRRRYDGLERRPEDRLLTQLFERGGTGVVVGRDWLASRRLPLARKIQRTRGHGGYASEQVLRNWIHRAHVLGLGRPRVPGEEIERELARAVRQLLRNERRPEFAR